MPQTPGLLEHPPKARGARSEVDEVQGQSDEQQRAIHVAGADHHPHALKDIRGGQAPGDRLQPRRQDVHRIKHRRKRLNEER